MKKLSLLLATILVFAMTFTSFGANFPDVSSDHWANDAINELVAAGIVEGFPDGSFKPDEEFTREQMAVVVSRLLATINEDVDSINEDTSTLQDEVDELSGGLTTEQAQDVESMVKVLMEENGSDEEPEGITEEEATEMIEELTEEFAVDVMNLESDLAAHIERTEIQFEYLEEQIDEK
ncbi:MAG: S-layer homology domain-containing protein, partial [Bacillota bacterium]